MAAKITPKEGRVRTSLFFLIYFMEFNLIERCVADKQRYVKFSCNKCGKQIILTPENTDVSMFETALKYQDTLTKMHSCGSLLKQEEIQNSISFMLWTNPYKWFTVRQIRAHLMKHNMKVSDEDVLYYTKQLCEKYKTSTFVRFVNNERNLIQCQAKTHAV